MVLKVEEELYKVFEVTHVTPGKGQAIIQTKLRKLKDKTQHDYRFRSKDRVDQVHLEGIEMEYLYQEGDEYIFMNLSNYEQINLTSEILGNAVHYLIPNVVFTIEMFEGIGKQQAGYPGNRHYYQCPSVHKRRRSYPHRH